ncbi:MAG TPA: hypothetical protein VGX94_03725 [Terriglobia bacterium]|nr:hypothetical protein [Terriglobia bacterium]
MERLSGLFSKYFLVADYFPVLIFLGVNGYYLYCVNLTFHQAVGQDLTKETFQTVGVLIAAGVLAFLLSTMSQALREALENPWFLPQKLRKEMETQRLEERASWDDQLEQMRRARLQFIRDQASWDALLRQARQIGETLKTTNAYSTPSSFDSLLLRFRRGEQPARDDIDSVVTQFADLLRANNPSEKDSAVPPKRTPNAASLDSDEVRFRNFLQTLPNRSESEAFSLYNRLQLNFARNQIAATRMGNIALSVQGYFTSRYSLNFNFFWTRIQQVLQKEDKFFDVLQAAKAQLDFHVALFWLLFLFAVVWTPCSALWSFSIWLLAFAVIGAPLAAWMFYELAVQSYRAYADLLRTTVDLYHFNLLNSLHIRHPASIDDERQVWIAINQWLGLGDYRDVEYSSSPAPVRSGAAGTP